MLMLFLNKFRLTIDSIVFSAENISMVLDLYRKLIVISYFPKQYTYAALSYSFRSIV